MKEKEEYILMRIMLPVNNKQTRIYKKKKGIKKASKSYLVDFDSNKLIIS